MNKLAKMLSLAMVSALVISGCMNSSPGTSESEAPESGTTEEAGSEVMRFSVTLPSNGVDNPNSLVGKEWHKQMEAYMGKKVEIEYNYIPSSEYDEKVKLMIASDDLTDFFVTPLFYDVSALP